jgi:hypothetical protein
LSPVCVWLLKAKTLISSVETTHTCGSHSFFFEKVAWGQSSFVTITRHCNLFKVIIKSMGTFWSQLKCRY